MMDRLEVLVGAWEMETSQEGQVVARGLSVYGWLESGRFLVQHSDGEVLDSAPDRWRENWPLPSTSIIGLDDATEEFTMLYADARGVFRVYRMAADKEGITIWREAPGFHQRFTGTFTDGGDTLVARWEMSTDGAQWSTDFEQVFRRVPA